MLSATCILWSAIPEVRLLGNFAAQIVQGLKQFHKSGIVHRDVKPSNLVLMGRQYKFVDFGAATDLRVGKNYDPEQSLLDPGYSPPEQYIMPGARLVLLVVDDFLIWD